MQFQPPNWFASGFPFQRRSDGPITHERGHWHSGGAFSLPFLDIYEETNL